MKEKLHKKNIVNTLLVINGKHFSNQPRPKVSCLFDKWESDQTSIFFTLPRFEDTRQVSFSKCEDSLLFLELQGLMLGTFHLQIVTNKQSLETKLRVLILGKPRNPGYEVAIFGCRHNWPYSKINMAPSFVLAPMQSVFVELFFGQIWLTNKNDNTMWVRDEKYSVLFTKFILFYVPQTHFPAK